LDRDITDGSRSEPEQTTMTKSNDDTRNPNTSIRDQLRVYTNNIGSNPRGREEGFTVTPPSTFEGNEFTAVFVTCPEKNWAYGTPSIFQ
jgi:hypothetical protein